MLATSSGLLRAGLELKLNQVKRATRSYISDRADQATGTATSYAVAAGLFAASGVFAIAACLVGLAALFRWIEINYGIFWAFGAVGLLLLVIAGICASLAASRLNRKPRQFPSLTSRLRVAIKGGIKNRPAKPDRVEAATDTAAAILRAPASPLPPTSRVRPSMPRPPMRNQREVQAGLIVAATLLGWAAARRVRQARRTPV